MFSRVALIASPVLLSTTPPLVQSMSEPVHSGTKPLACSTVAGASQASPKVARCLGRHGETAVVGPELPP